MQYIRTATSDGRYDGDATSFGIVQSEGKDRCSITSHLSSVAKCDPGHVMPDPSVTNVMIDENLVDLLETYFEMGGTHFHLTYVSKEDFVVAKKEPEKYKSLRVRVSVFSDYFIFLNEALQDEIILRTEHTS